MANPVSPSAAPPRRKPAEENSSLTTLFGSGSTTYGVDRRSFLLSYLFNTLVTIIAIYGSYWVASHHQQIKQQLSSVAIEISPYVLKPSATESGGGGGGGDHDKLAAAKGTLPKQAREQFTPPVVVIRNEHPKLEVDPTVVAPPVMVTNMANIGDPLSKVIGPPSNGTGSG